jgi:hypothetical protein
MMHLDEVKERLKQVSFDTLRLDCDNHFEVVVVKNELEKLNLHLKSLFGDPAWPSETKMNRQMQEVINGFGGIMSGQTLYFWSHGKDTVFAMLWPWQDGVRTTVKVIQK